MRAARAGDHWRGAIRRDYPVRCTDINYENLLGLGKGGIKFKGGISAIVGGNGVGKSTVVAALAELLGGEDALADLDHGARLRGSSVEGVILSKAKEYRYSIGPVEKGRATAGELPADFEFSWIDPAYQTARARNLIAKDSNFEEVLESVGPRKLGAEALETLEYVVGKRYTSCDVYEVPEYGGIEPFVYFRVTAHGATYGSETMGQGELSLMFVLWELMNLPRNAVLLLEEPETHVSPRSQDALMNILAKAADESGISTIVTTHSPVILDKIPTKDICLLTRNGDRVETIESPARYQLAAILGGRYGYNGAMLVEDECAKLFAMSILEIVDPDLLRQYEIVNAISDSGIARALESMPLTKKWLRIVGAFDGDLQGKVEGKFKWPIIFLPGKRAPEKMLVDTMMATDVTILAKEFGVERAIVLAAIGATEGMDGHDRIFKVAEMCGMGLDRSVRHLVEIWLRDGGNAEAAKAFVDALRAQ